jgi:origin recognition complex subunit 3
LLLTMKKIPSDVAKAFLEAILAMDLADGLRVNINDILFELVELLKTNTSTGQPLRSEDDIRNSTLRTTVVAQKVELNKQKSALSKQDKAYTELLARLSKTFEEHFAATLIDPRSLVFHEVFIFDQKSPYREVFMPRPRHAIERALASPHDYLACECCAPESEGEKNEATLSSSQPPAAVLYQLYLESGNLVNVSDMWQAFQAVIGDGKDEVELMAVFQRALAELKSFGMMKSTRKRVDHVAKVLWRGL